MGCSVFYGVSSYTCGYGGIVIAAEVVAAVHRGCTKTCKGGSVALIGGASPHYEGGDVLVVAGDSPGGGGGSVSIRTGSTTSADGDGGKLALLTGYATEQVSGAIDILTGVGRNNAKSGPITIATGTSACLASFSRCREAAVLCC